MLIKKVFQEVVKEPDRIAIKTENKETSYLELIRISATIANKLRCLGIGNGEIVSIELPNDEIFIAAILGIWMCHSIFIPFDYNKTKEELDQIAKDIKPVIRINLDFFKEIKNQETIDIMEEPVEDNIALLIDNVSYNHKALLDSVLNLSKDLNFSNKRSKDKIAITLPFNSLEAIEAIFSALINGITIYPIPNSDTNLEEFLNNNEIKRYI